MIGSLRAQTAYPQSGKKMTLEGKSYSELIGGEKRPFWGKEKEPLMVEGRERE